MLAKTLGSPAETAFSVFVSSAQQEFEQFRQDLKETIESESWSNRYLMKAILIENRRGPVIHEEIRRGLDDAAIYVGIFGKQLREWPRAEFFYAKACGLPMLLYKVERRNRPGRPPHGRRRGRKSKVDKFLDDEAKSSGIRVNGPYRHAHYLLDVIPADLAETTAKMVKENADIRRRLQSSIPVIR